MRYVRRRFMAVIVESEHTVEKHELIKAIWDMIYQLYGEYGASQVGMSHIDLQHDKEITVLRCSHNAVHMVRAAMALISDINNKPAVLRVVAISGTLKSLRQKIHHLRKK